MASAAPQIDTGTDIPGEAQIEGQPQSPRDFEAEAREHGWRPKDEWLKNNPNADPERFVDAETFMKKYDDVMPLLKAANSRLKRELDDIKKELKRATKHFEGVEKRAYDKAIADLELKHKEAVEAGDISAATDAVRQMRDLKPTVDEQWSAGKSQDEIRREAQDAFADFREENSWYDKANLASATELEVQARLYADRMSDKHIEESKTMPPAEFFAMIRDLTLEKYPQLTAKPTREKPASAVAGTTSGKPRGSSKSWDNLPESAKRQYSRFIERGIGVKSTGDKEKDLASARAYYAKTHDWEGYSE